MKINYLNKYKLVACIHSCAVMLTLFVFLTISKAQAQTFTDGQMMGKGLFCGGLSYTHESWKNYWEGTLKRENLNLGTVSTQNIAVMGALGINKNINVMFMLPYVWTKASAGTLVGMNGLQDISIGFKYRPIDLKSDFGRFTLMAVGAFSAPMSSYTADFLPLSIGLESKTLSGRLIAHYRLKNGIFATAQGGYVWRSNITIDRTSYYTDGQQFRTDQVQMPNLMHFTARTGYMQDHLILEAFFENMNTLGGGDIRRNDMPFPSNKMIFSKVGIMGTYRPKGLKGLGFILSASTTLSGRNVGKSDNLTASLLYIFKGWKVIEQK
ncbi:MAG: transporter [Cytophagales bacterium]|nr:MAG: transporter [Cytophagales bacterium]